MLFKDRGGGLLLPPGQDQQSHLLISCFSHLWIFSRTRPAQSIQSIRTQSPAGEEWDLIDWFNERRQKKLASPVFFRGGGECDECDGDGVFTRNSVITSGRRGW